MGDSSRTRVSINSIHELYRRKVWDARIPLQIVISGEELQRYLPREAALELCRTVKSRPFFILAHRTSYFPLLMTELRRHYHAVFTAIESALEGTLVTPWLDCEGHPLAWHYYIGHLFDEFCCWYPSRVSCPWTLTLHLTEYPKSTILPDYAGRIEEGGGGAIGRHFYTMLKQADYIRHGSCKAINALSKSEQTQLWDGLWTHSFDKFWRINTKLLGDDPVKNWKGIPLKVYIKDESTSRRIFQNPLKLLSASTTLSDALSLLLGGTDDDHSTSPARVYMHGIELPTDASISWLSSYFAYPDGFLHLIVY